MSMKNPQHFTAASTVPAKLLRNALLVQCIRERNVIPVHPQLIPTNRCNLNCGFCSCKNRDKTLEMPLDDGVSMMKWFSDRGAKAVTITGGGEPMLYRRINELILAIHRMGIKIGLVSNGIALRNLSAEAGEAITWCRVSASDEDNRLEGLQKQVERFPRIDWALSYVVTANPDIKNIGQHIQFANTLKMTHIRLVSDLLDLDNAAQMNLIKSTVAGMGIVDRRVIYQSRTAYVTGASRCWISLLKPVIGPDLTFYPCCGVQYAEDNMSLDLGNTMAMGRWPEVIRRWRTEDMQCPFNGEGCSRCYYGEYNAVMEALVAENRHAEFV